MSVSFSAGIRLRLSASSSLRTRGWQGIDNEFLPYSFGAKLPPVKTGIASYSGTYLPRVLSRLGNKAAGPRGGHPWCHPGGFLLPRMSSRTFRVAVSCVIATTVEQCRLSAALLRRNALCCPLLCFFALLYLPTVLQRRSAMCRERQNLAHISLSQSKLLVIGPFLCSEREITEGISLSRERAMVSADEVTEACRKMGRLRQNRPFLTEAGRFVGRLRHLERWRHSCVSGFFFLTFLYKSFLQLLERR